MQESVKVAAVQLNVSDDKQANVSKALELTKEAAANAGFVALPEYFTYMGSDAGAIASAESIPGPTTAMFAQIAQQCSVYVHLGSLLEKSDDPNRVYNTSVLISPTGDIRAYYRKIHLFDAGLSGNAVYRESDWVKPGDQVVVAETSLGKIGLSICYDLRFPELYRALADRGASIIMVPAAFTEQTGKDHWEPLLRARAIENQAYVVAPAVWGAVPENKRTYGRSMVIDPWGIVLAKASDADGIIYANLSASVLQRVRRQVPSLEHRRYDLFPASNVAPGTPKNCQEYYSDAL